MYVLRSDCRTENRPAYVERTSWPGRGCVWEWWPRCQARIKRVRIASVSSRPTLHHAPEKKNRYSTEPPDADPEPRRVDLHYDKTPALLVLLYIYVFVFFSLGS
jgi:hypothetical protein